VARGPGVPIAQAAPQAPPHVIDNIRAREAEILAWVERNDPDSFRRLNRLKHEDPRGYLGQLVRTARLMERAEDDPEVVARHKKIRKLERQFRELVVEHKALDAKEQKARVAELEALAGELFELRQAERRAQLEELEVRIEELGQEIEERDEDRRRIIEAFVAQQTRGEVEL
jgi:replicative DNA helicase